MASLLAAIFALLLGQPSFAQTTTWPADKPITLIVPYTAGGSVDFVARLVGQHLGARLKQTVVVENVGGAGGAIGVARAVRAPPDGYTLVMGPDSPIAIAGLVNPAAVKYDAMKDLIPVGLVNTAPMVLVARPGLPITSMQDLVKLASTQPGKADLRDLRYRHRPAPCDGDHQVAGQDRRDARALSWRCADHHRPDG
jgi:tripartite-type tricarboxylate transporter receptor subunit TctC